MKYCKYTQSQLQLAYKKWQATQSSIDLSIRRGAWDEYCDARDGLSKGTSEKIRLELDREKFERKHTVKEVVYLQ